MMKEVGRQGSAVKVGKEIGAPRFEPTSVIDAKPQIDHNWPQSVIILPPIRQPNPSLTTPRRMNCMPMSGYAALAGVVAAWPSLSSEDQQRILAIVQGRSAP